MASLDEEAPTVPGGPPKFPPTEPAAALIAEPGSSRYQPGTEVGRGGMGKVLAALEKPLQRSVALKVLLEPGDHADEQRFIREARITGQLEHPSIVPVHELGIDPEGHVFYTMKLVKGVTLLQVLHDLSEGNRETLRQYKLSDLLTIFQKVCDAVAFAHSQSPPIIHRDLKPANIMIGHYGEVLVMDWGAAKLLSAESNTREPAGKETTSTSPANLFHTQPGSIMGTPGYMAPEQVAGRTDLADERTDIYALGGILYSLLTLETPPRVTNEDIEDLEQTGSRTSILFRERVAPLLASARKAKAIPDSLAAVTLKAMSFKSEDRYASVKALQAEVAAYQAGRATVAEQAGTWKHFKLLVARNKVLFGAIAVIFAVLLAATAVSLYERQATLRSNQALQLTLHNASFADLQVARERFRSGVWREGLALLGRSLTFWPDNREAANYLLSAIVFGRGDRDRLPIFGVRHEAAVNECAFSPDGRYFATASYDHTTRIWRTATGRQAGKTMHHAGPCGMPCFSPDGRHLVTTGADGVALLWDVQTGEPLGKPMRHGRPDLDALSDVLSCVFSPDGKRILTASLDHTARVWDASSGNEIAQLVNPGRVADAVFSPDGTGILTSYWYGGAILWDAVTFQPIGAPMTHGATVKRSIFTPDGNKIVTSSLDKTTRIWNGHTAEPLSPPMNHTDFVWDLAVSPDGKLFATACYDKTVRLWSVEDGSPVGAPMEHEGPVDTVAFSPDGQRLVSASRDKTVRLWNVTASVPIGAPMHHDEAVLRALFAPDGKRVLSVGWDNAAYLWDAKPNSWPGEVIPLPGPVSLLEFDENEDDVFVATRNGLAGLWSLSRKEFVTPIIHGTPLSMAAFHPHTNKYATANSDGTLRFWNISNGKQIGEAKPEKDTIVGLSFSADGTSLFAAYLGGSVLHYKIPAGTQTGQPLKLSEKMDTLAVAPSGKEVATGCRDDYLYLWDTSDGNKLPRKLRHTNPVHAISYNPDGHFIATGCDDHTARIWSHDSGEQLGEPFYLKGRATAVHYTAGGKTLLIGGSEDTEVNCYDTRTHNSLCLPLPHPEGVSQITANTSGSLVVTVTNDGVARLWHIPSTNEPPPKWLPEYLRALGGLAFSAQQQLAQVPTRERLALRKRLLEQPSDGSVWDQLMRSSFEDGDTSAR